MPASKHVFKYSLVSMNHGIKTVKDLFKSFIPFLRPCAVHICFPHGRFDRDFFLFQLFEVVQSKVHVFESKVHLFQSTIA